MATVRRAQQSAVIKGLRSPSLPILLTAAALVVGLAALLPVVQFSGATTTNANVQQLERRDADWVARVQELEIDVASLGSLARIEKEARERLGMVTPSETVYITVPVLGPEPPKLPSRFLPPEEKPHASTASWWDNLFGWIPLD
ncbi:MAG: septum formation initiator family protein [Chloroflexi bacterium]|nr:septum formation initiator family protein [Chloroflexota bacterium]